MTDEGQQDPLSLSLKLIALKAEMLSFEIPDSHITYSALIINACTVQYVHQSGYRMLAKQLIQMEMRGVKYISKFKALV